MSHDHIAGSSVELIEVVFFKFTADQVMEFYWIAGSGRNYAGSYWRKILPTSVKSNSMDLLRTGPAFDYSDFFEELKYSLNLSGKVESLYIR